MIAEPHRLEDLEEGIGTLEEVKEQDGFTLARFEKFGILLPLEMAPHLNDLIGLRVGILRIDGSYRVKVDRRH